jgi:hypothetical protein
MRKPPLDLSKLDFDCRWMTREMNRFPGITTIESCSGHGKKPYHIWFRARRLSSLPPLLYWFDGCHTAVYGWRVLASTDCSARPLTFCVEGPTLTETNLAEVNLIALHLQMEADRRDEDRRDWLRLAWEAAASRTVCWLTHHGKRPEAGGAAYCYWCGRPVGNTFWPFPGRVT